MAYYIFLKSLRSLEEFRKNPHVKITPKSPSTNFPSLGKFKIQFLFERNYCSEFRPLSPAGLPTSLALAYRPAQPSPAQTAQPTRPLSRPARACLWCILHKTFSSLIHAFRPQRLLSLPSLTRGPCLLALSSTPRRPTPIAPPPSPAASDLSEPPLRTSRFRLSRYSTHNHFPLFKSRLNPP
jgi:hypothetical protein